MIQFRNATINDALALTNFVHKLDNESQYVLFGPGERNINEDTTRIYLHQIVQNEKSAVFIAMNTDNEIIGFICGEAHRIKRLSHVLKINIGILNKYQKLGLGRKLASLMDAHIKNVGIIRAEFTVIKENIKSVNLCKKFGCTIEGIKRSSVKIGERLYDEYLFSKIYC